MPEETKAPEANPAETVVATETPAEATAPEVVKVPEVDRFAELEARLAEKEKYIGKMQMEVGETRNQMRQQAQRMAELENYLSQQANPPRDFNSEYKQLQEQVDSGSLSMGEAMAIAAQISREQALAESNAQMEMALNNRDQQERQFELENDWKRLNPDYVDFYQAGLGKQFSQEHAFYNDGPLAYEHYKRKEAEKLAELKFEEGKRKGLEEAKKLLQGTGEGQKILQDPGSSAARVPTASPSRDQLKSQFIKDYMEGKFK